MIEMIIVWFAILLAIIWIAVILFGLITELQHQRAMREYKRAQTVVFRTTRAKGKAE